MPGVKPDLVLIAPVTGPGIREGRTVRWVSVGTVDIRAG